MSAAQSETSSNNTFKDSDKSDKKPIGLQIFEISFTLLIAIVVIGSGIILYQLDSYIEFIREMDPSYPFPKKSELIYALISFISFTITYHILKTIFNKFTGKMLVEKYITGNEQNNYEYYREKVSIYLVKLIFLFFVTILGHFILRDLVFFPKSLLGRGDYKILFATGKKMFFFDKTPYFDLFYNINLGWALFDTYLVLTLPHQSDFLIMILHHLATISLVTFSYLINYSNVGCVVFYLHYFGDAFGYILRLFVYIKVPRMFKYVSGFLVIILFFYTRIYVFGFVLYDTYHLLPFWGTIEKFCMVFMIFLYNLHIIWLTLIIKKVYHYFRFGEAEELYKTSGNSKNN